MRPLRLTAQAFEPFAERIAIPFQALGNTPVFGIYGPTGSGKTSILDGLCYALFGQSSGGEREHRHLRSHHADANTETFVELIFALGQRRYLIRRSPEQDIAKRRGAGTIRRLHEAYLFDVTGMEPDRVSFPLDCGTVVVEKKVSKVDEAIRELLGYSAAQFRQIVVLPQGRFRELLVAKGSERADILTQLFQAELYERIVLTLRERSTALERQMNQRAVAMRTILEGTGVATANELTAGIAATETDIAAAQPVVAARSAEKQAADQALDIGNRTAALFRELDEATHALAAIEAERDAIDAAAHELRAAEIAARVAPAAEAADRAAAEFQQKCTDRDRKQRDREAATANAETATAAFQASLAAEPERQAARRQADDLERFAGIWAGLDDKRAAARAASIDREAADHAVAMAAAAVGTLNDRAQAAVEAERGLAEARVRKAELDRERERLSGQRALLDELQQKRRALEEQQQARRATEHSLEAASRDAEAARVRLDAVHAAFIATAASGLARELQAGEPCPVCGATDHPSPATFDATTAATRDDVQSADAACRDADSRRTEVQGRLAAIAAAIEALTARIAELEPAVPPHITLPDLDAALRTLDRDAREVGALVATEGAILAETQASEKALAQAREKEARARDTAIAAEKEKTTRCAELAAALREVPEDLRDGHALGVALAAARTKAAALLAEHQRLADAQSAAERAASVAQALLQEAEAAAKQAEAAVSVARAGLVDALRRHDFADERTFRETQRNPEAIDALRQRIAAFQTRSAAARTREQRAREAVADHQRPDLEALRGASEAARLALEAARDRWRDLERERDRLRDAQRRYQEQADAHAVLDQQHRTAARLAEVAAGKEPNRQKIPLINWVLAAFFEDVLTEANARFDRMSRGRYQLRRRPDRVGGRGTAGLDIAVYDAYTDQERDPATLSGGESFLAALSLALGLADVVQAEAGGVRLDTIFIDEGFGHLDDEALDQALATLVELSGSAKTVGVISHVEEVKRMIPAGFELVPSTRGSSVRLRAGS